MQSRLAIVLAIFGGMLLIIICGLIKVQVIDAQKLQEAALSQWTRTSQLEAARGDIVDRNGVVLAKSGTAYKVLLWPKNIDKSEREQRSSAVCSICLSQRCMRRSVIRANRR